LSENANVAYRNGLPEFAGRRIFARSGVSGEESEVAEILGGLSPELFVSGHDHAFPRRVCGYGVASGFRLTTSRREYSLDIAVSPQ
jgi:hypothetical protein